MNVSGPSISTTSAGADAMNLNRTMSAIEYAADRDLSDYEKRDELLEAKFAYIDKRTEELHEKRTAGIPTDEDFIIALERLTTLPSLVTLLKRRIYERDEFLPDYLAGAIRGALRLDSAAIAKTEADVLFDESVSTERH